MVIPDSRTSRSAIARISLATGIGAVFGFQAWRMALNGFPIVMPWYGALWVFLRHVALGFAIGIVRHPKSWWARGLSWGALFSLPSVVALRAMTPGGAARALALCAGTMAAGVLIAVLTDSICPRKPEPPPEVEDADILEPLAAEDSSARRPQPADELGRRLVDGKSRIEELDAERKMRRDPGFAQAAEDRIVWRELLDLELQEIDDRVARSRGGKGRL